MNLNISIRWDASHQLKAIMAHSDILISGSKTIIYVIKEQSVQAASLSDLRALLVCVFFL